MEHLESHTMLNACGLMQEKGSWIVSGDDMQIDLTLPELSMEGVLLCNRAQSLKMNGAFREMFGYALDELKPGKLPDLIISEKDRECVKSVNLHRDMVHCQVSGMRKDGSGFPLNILIQSFTYKGEKLYVIITRDLTEQKAAEKRIRKSEEQYRMLIENLQEGIWQIDSLGVTQRVNSRMAKLIGLSPADIIGKPVFDFINPEAAEFLKHKIRNRQKGITEIYDLEVITHDNRSVFVSVTALPLQDEEGNFISSIGAISDITERKKAEKQLHENQLFLNRIAEQSPDIIYIYDVRSDSILYVNKSLGEMLGYPKDEATENYLTLIDHLIHPDDRHRFFDFKDRIVSWDNQHVDEFSFRLKNKSGHWRWFAGRAKEFRREQNQIVSVLGLLSDITLQKTAESALKLNEEKFRLAFKTSPNAIGIMRLPGLEFVEVNEGMVEMSGYREDELIGKDPLILDIPLNRQAWETLSGKIRTTGHFNNFEQGFRRKDGKILDTLLSVNSFSANEEPLILVIARDITEVKTANTALQESEEKFSKAFGLSPDLICLIDENTLTISDINNSITDTLGYQKEELIGLKFADLGKVTDQENLFANLTRYRNNKGKLQKEVSIKAKNGTIRTCEMSATRLSINQSNFIMVILRDITERKEAEIKLEKNREEMIDLNKRIAEYKVMALRSAMNPHFIFNSLNSIQYYIGVNEKKLATTYLSLFSKLIRNILDSSVNDKNTLERELETLTYYMQIEKMRFEDKFEFEIEVDDEIEQEHIQVPSLIFQPFVENAIHHGLLPKQGPGRIHVGIRRTDEGILCSISDSGIGLEAARKLKEKQQKTHASFGVSLTKQRLDVVNKTENVSVHYTNLHDEEGKPAGTKVEIFIIS